MVEDTIIWKQVQSSAIEGRTFHIIMWRGINSDITVIEIMLQFSYVATTQSKNEQTNVIYT